MVTRRFGRPPTIVVLGGGVAGLSTAALLLLEGLRVRIVSERFIRGLTTLVAGALWEWPPAVCGFFHQHPQEAQLAEKSWAAVSYRQFAAMASAGTPGVFMRPVTFYLEQPAHTDAAETRKIAELTPHVSGFAQGESLLDRPEIEAKQLGYVDAYRYLAPQIDTDAYLAWLTHWVLALGGSLHPARLSGRLTDLVGLLADAHRADGIVNCLGLGAADLTEDPAMLPVRGGWWLVTREGLSGPAVKEAHCTSLQSVDGNGGNFLFLLPRGRDRLVIGGFTDPVPDRPDQSARDRTALDRVREEAIAFLPALRQVDFSAAETRVGARPFRRTGVRVESEPSSIPLVHHYGHGGSGVTLSWGSARLAVEVMLASLGLGPSRLPEIVLPEALTVAQ